MERSRQSADREQSDLGHMPVLGSVGGVFWDSWAKARLSIQTKRREFGKFYGGSYLRTAQGNAVEAQEFVDHKGYWEIILGISVGCYLVCALS